MFTALFAKVFLVLIKEAITTTTFTLATTSTAKVIFLITFKSNKKDISLMLAYFASFRKTSHKSCKNVNRNILMHKFLSCQILLLQSESWPFFYHRWQETVLLGVNFLKSQRMQQIITTKKMLAENGEWKQHFDSCNDLLRFNSLSLAAKVVFKKVAQLQNCFLSLIVKNGDLLDCKSRIRQLKNLCMRIFLFTFLQLLWEVFQKLAKYANLWDIRKTNFSILSTWFRNFRWHPELSFLDSVFRVI